MAFSLDKILNSTYLPHWFEECEIQQGTFDISQDVTLDEALETYTTNVFGISNRPLHALYALNKINAAIARAHHYSNGSHHIADVDVINNALIRETPDTNDDLLNDPFLTTDRKLLLDFYGMEIPDEITPLEYSTTQQLARKINELYAHIDILRKGLGSHIAFRHTIESMIEKEEGVTGFVVEPSFINESPKLAFNILNNTLFINGKKVIMKNTGSLTINIIALNSPSKVMNTDPVAEIVYLEIYLTALTNSHKPYGNRQYSSPAVTITPGSTINWLPYIADKENNIFINPSFALTQLQYKISSQTFNPSTSSYGIDQILVNGMNIVKSTIRGLWRDVNSAFLVFPIMVIGSRNYGIYHSLNPGGTAVKRTGSTIASVEDCFKYELIGYFNNGVECPLYNSLSYSEITDAYTYNNVVYYRSGNSLSLKTGCPMNHYADKIYLEDAVMIGKTIEHNTSSVVNILTEKILGNDLYTELSPVMKNLASNMLPGKHYSRNPIQVIGFGENTEQLFGLVNHGGIFVNETNNELDGTSDHVRTYWGDPSYNAPMSFSFVEGNNNSETRSYLTYEPISQSVTLNTTPLSGTPNISVIAPVMVWDDGTTVACSAWTGLGTTSATTIITPKTGRTVYGLVNFAYSLGSGVPYILDGTIKVTDLAGNDLNFCIQKSDTFCLACTWTGLPDSGDTDHIVLPSCIECDFPNDLTNGYALVLSGNNAGEYRKITSYDCDSRVVLFETDFAVALTNTDKISIGKLEPDHTTVVINPFGRGVTGAFKRQRILTTSVRYFSSLPIVDYSDGTLTGTVLSGLTMGTYIEVVTREDEPLTTGFYIYTVCNPMFNQYKAIPNCEIKIIKPGNLIDTTKGSANTPFSLYRQFVPSYSTMSVDDTKWISTDCLAPIFALKPIEYWDINYAIRPTESLILDCLNSVITSRKLKLGDIQSVVSDITIVLPNNRLVMGVTLVEISSWWYLLVTPRHVGTFGVTSGYLIDINKIY